MLKRIIYTFVLLSLIASVAAPAFAVSVNAHVCLETSLVSDPWLDESEVDSSASATAYVNIRNIRSGEYLYSNVLIIAKVTGTFSKVYYNIDLKGTKYSMYRVGTTSMFRATWNTTPFTAGSHTLYVGALDSIGNLVGYSSVTVNVVKAYRYELYYEIDYMSGHYPPSSVRTYMQNYWKGHAIKVSFWVDDVVTDPTPADNITKSDFWKIEKKYNNVWKYDDRSSGGLYPKYTLKEKWMLYGTWEQGKPNTGGFTYVTISGSDVLAGNYIFIADSMIDKWEATNSVPYEGGEETVVLHEAGHSIGIAKLSTTGYEVYDPDYYSVMSLIRLQNAKYMARYWYYSKEYWATTNRAYYLI